MTASCPVCGRPVMRLQPSRGVVEVLPCGCRVAPAAVEDLPAHLPQAAQPGRRGGVTYTIGTLCSGVDMLGIAVDASAPGRTRLWHAEIDSGASLILAAHQPKVPNLGDITGGAPAGCDAAVMRKMAYVKWAGAPRVDEIHSTHPCQGNSKAGRKRGAADERNLWPAIAGCVEAQMPSVFVAENVPGLLDIDQGNLFGQMLADLDDLGYTTRWTTVGACRTGGCHHRHRVFLRASRGGVAPDRGPVAWRRHGGWVASDADLFGDPVPVETWPTAGVAGSGQAWFSTPAVCGDNGLTLFPTPCARDGDGRGEGSPDYWRRRKAAGNTRGMPLGSAVLAFPDGGWGVFAAAVRRWEAVIGRPAPSPTSVGPKGGVGLAAPFVEWMLGLDLGYVSGYVDNDVALRILGNGIHWRAAVLALSNLAGAARVSEVTA